MLEAHLNQKDAYEYSAGNKHTAFVKELRRIAISRTGLPVIKIRR